MYMFFGHANTCIADFHTQAWLAIFLYPRKHHLYLPFSGVNLKAFDNKL